MLDQIRSMPLDQLVGDALVRLRRLVVSDYHRASMIYIGILLAMTIAYLLSMPVGSGDTDLWYHLNGGRLLWEFDRLPDSAFYSFMDNERGWVNYFWGFQALSYQIHRLTGYEGLILLRVALFGTTVAVLAALLVRPGDRPSQRAWALTLLVLVVLVLVGRTGQIRPHLVSYCMIALFLLILEHRRRWLPALPVLSIAWANLHGVEWPVGALICGAYFLEAAWRLYRTAPSAAEDRKVLLWTTACLPALLINPFGIQILTAPFSTPPDVYAYIAELKPYSLWTLFSVNLTGPIISVTGAIALLSWGNLLAYGYLFIRRRLRFAPLVLSLAGLLLMSRGTRFIWEWVLLSLPLWRIAIDAKRDHQTDVDHPHIRIGDLLVFLILLSPAVSWVMDARTFRHWPLDPQHLPVGTMDFLASEQATGRLMTPPDFGGYIAWRLYPQVLISGDMSTPPTMPWDHFRRLAAVIDGDALRRFIEEFHPEFIAVELGRKHFPKLIKEHADYRPVFFDDQLALYADRSQRPDLVARHELTQLNPFNLIDDTAGSAEQRIESLRQVLKLQPDGDRVQHALTRLLFDAGRYQEALPYAEHFVATVPQNPNSHYLLGNLLENLNRCDEARAHYLDALAIAPDDFHRTLHQHLGACAYLSKDFQSAYRHFEQGLNPYLQREEPEHLYQYAFSAMATGKDEAARTLLRQLLYTAPPEDTPVTRRARALLADL